MNLFAPFNSDGYKLAHAQMYSDGTEIVYNNLTPRTDKIYRRSCTRYYDGKLVYIGGQGAMHEIVENWNKFFAMPKQEALDLYKELCDNYLGEGAIPVENLANLHDLGYLPLEIKTLDEGTKVPMGVPVMTIVNTVPSAYWLVNFLETTVSNLTWKTSTAATIAAEYKAMLVDYAIKTGTPVESVLFQAHSFACRGMSGGEDSARSELGHIASFLGTDSLGSILYARQYYGARGFVAASVPATEHAVATSNILRIERELESGEYVLVSYEQEEILVKMKRAKEDPRLIAEVMFLYELMKKFPTGILSYVADSFDFWALISKGLPYLKEVIEARDGKLVIRPDSGIPEDVVCGAHFIETGARGWNAHSEIAVEEYFRKNKDQFPVDDSEGEGYEIVVVNEYGEYFGVQMSCYVYDGDYDCETSCAWVIDEPTAEQKGAVRVLNEIFGGEETSEGYILNNDKIGLIYGDSITTKRCLTILTRLEQNGFASGNCVFGVGSYTYQCVTRDTFGFAVKATYTRVNGEDIAIFKDPKTDSKKKSAKGLLWVGVGVDGEYFLQDNVTPAQEANWTNQLTTRFKDGVFYNQTTLDIIRSKL